MKWASQLQSLYPEQESSVLVEWLFEHHLGLRRIDFLHFLDEKDLPDLLFKDFERLKTGEPIQYILGHGPFYGRDFFVSPATLIPRNETEELVHLILKENPFPSLKILDIGTGTGCIPITLNLEKKSWDVWGLDISEEALEIAMKNNQRHRARVQFFSLDILNETPSLSDLDILVSNPPYIPKQEEAFMHSNVKDFEPKIALFVPNDDPLLFYRVIAKKGQQLLKKHGKIYFEIWEKAGAEVFNLLKIEDYDQITLHQDLNGKDRMISATRR